MLEFSNKLSILQTENLLSYLNISLMKKSVNIDISYFDIPSKFDEMSKSRQNTHAIHQIVFSTIKTFSNIVFLISALILALKINYIFVFIILFSFLPYFIFKKDIEKKFYLFDKKIHKDVRISQYFFNLIFDRKSIKEFKLFNIGEVFLNNYLNLNERIITKKNKFNNKINLYNIIFELPFFIINISIQIYVILKIIKKLLSLGDYTYITGMYNNLKNSLENTINDISTYIGYNEQIMDFKKYFSFDEYTDSGSTKIDTINELEFKSVSFRYPETDIYVLKNVNFKIKKGEKVALIGLNGAGKTTIIKLIVKFYKPTEGDIYINGLNLNDVDLQSYRNNISTVFQDFNIYSFTLMNILVV